MNRRPFEKPLRGDWPRLDVLWDLVAIFEEARRVPSRPKWHRITDEARASGPVTGFMRPEEDKDR